MEEFEWPPSTSTLQANNFTSEGISEFCTNWMKAIKSAVVVQDRPRHIRPSNLISKFLVLVQISFLVLNAMAMYTS